MSQESAGEEDPSWKGSANEEEERRHPEQGSWGAPAPSRGRTDGRAEVERVVPTDIIPGSTGPTEGSGNRSTSPSWGSAVHSPRSLAYEPYSPLFVPRSPSYEPCFPRYEPCSPSYDPNSPRYEPRSPSYYPIFPRYELWSPSHEPQSDHLLTHSPHPDPKAEAPTHREVNPCLHLSHGPEAGHKDLQVTSPDASSEEDILTYSLNSEEEVRPS